MAQNKEPEATLLHSGFQKASLPVQDSDCHKTTQRQESFCCLECRMSGNLVCFYFSTCKSRVLYLET